VAEFLDSLLAPSALGQELEALRTSGELEEAREALESGEYERGLDLLFAAAKAGDDERRELVRRLMVAVFAELGLEDPLSLRYRRLLATLLF
jgi:thioredoxin-like negative regulator of GroEL